jgi:hypothetical protein
MTNLWNIEDDDDELYEKKDLEIDLEDIDLNADEDDVICLQCGEIIEDGIQCSFCGWVREI